MDTCTICLEDITTDIVKSQCCRRQFHFACIKLWLDDGRKSTCPDCRAQVTIDSYKTQPQAIPKSIIHNSSTTIQQQPTPSAPPLPDEEDGFFDPPVIGFKFVPIKVRGNWIREAVSVYPELKTHLYRERAVTKTPRCYEILEELGIMDMQFPRPSDMLQFAGDLSDTQCRYVLVRQRDLKLLEYEATLASQPFRGNPVIFCAGDIFPFEVKEFPECDIVAVERWMLHMWCQHLKSFNKQLKRFGYKADWF